MSSRRTTDIIKIQPTTDKIKMDLCIICKETTEEGRETVTLKGKVLKVLTNQVKSGEIRLKLALALLYTKHVYLTIQILTTLRYILKRVEKLP